MTDKQIIIDGVDVSGCKCIIEDYQRANNFEGRYEHIKNVCELGERGAEYYNLFCKDNPNCYYKQLKRKEQECQEVMDNYVKLDNQRVREYNKLVDKYKAKEQECESLKSAFSLDTKMLEQTEERVSDLEKQLDQLKAENEELKEKFKKFFNMDNQECWNIAFLDNERERYKQAIDLISDICNEMDGVYPLSLDILDIINKAKEE